MKRIVIVEVRNAILGYSEFWRGPAEAAAVATLQQIRNVYALRLARETARDGVTRSMGMWHSRAEDEMPT